MSVVLCSRNLCGHLRIELLFFNKKGFFMNIVVAFRAKCKMFSRHLQKPILKTEKGRFKGL